MCRTMLQSKDFAEYLDYIRRKYQCSSQSYTVGFHIALCCGVFNEYILHIYMVNYIRLLCDSGVNCYCLTM